LADGEIAALDVERNKSPGRKLGVLSAGAYREQRFERQRRPCDEIICKAFKHVGGLSGCGRDTQSRTKPN
jgi:hypothetical protein